MARQPTSGAAAGRLAAVAGDLRPALLDAWRALWLSRSVVWIAGVGAVLLWGVREDNAARFDPGGLTRPFGDPGDHLVAPAARWDAVWYLRIADEGYAGDPDRPAFFPLYPVLVRVAGFAIGSDLVGGMLLSLGCLLAALVLLHRLVEPDFGAQAARLVVLLVAAFPGALWFSAIYSEALFLLLSVGAVLAARTDRWAVAGAAGALAAATRSAGLLLVVPLAILWWQRREGGLARAGWIALVPAGLAAYCAALAVAGQDPLAPLNAQQAWNRAFAGPFGAVPEAVDAGIDGIRGILAGAPPPPAAFDVRWLDAALLATLGLVLVATVGAVRRLPPAYGVYAVAALALPLSYPAAGQPLMSLPRFVAVLWPLHLWLALVLVRRRPAVRRAAVAVSLAGLALVSGEVSTWGWVA